MKKLLLATMIVSVTSFGALAQTATTAPTPAPNTEADKNAPLPGAGVSEEDAHYYAETVRRGGTVVSVKATDAHAATAEAIMDGATPIDRDTRMAQYRQEGWTRFDEKAEPYRAPATAI